MKALSLKQPYAELILQGKKTIELRTWNTKFRGAFLIHASKTPDMKAMKQFGFTNLSCGYIVGKATLVNVKKYATEQEHQKDKHLHVASSTWGTYGFILKNPKRISPVPARGNLNFWEHKSTTL